MRKSILAVAITASASVVLASALAPAATASAPAADKGVADVEAALEGARFILLEQFAEDAPLIGKVRKWLEDESRVVTKVSKGKETDPEAQRYRDYFRYDEPLARVPSHRALAIFRAKKEGFLDGFLGFALSRLDGILAQAVGGALQDRDGDVVLS